nr:hypothetical protein [Tanacetum cinerariifolium]
SASTPIDTEKPLLKDPDAEDVDVHTYRSMIGSLMYLTSSRPDIMFAVCTCWKFLIHTILQSMSAKCTSWNEFSSVMASAVICLSTDQPIPSPTPPTPPPQQPQDLPSTSQVGTSQRIDTSYDTVIEDASNQGRMIDALDSNTGVALMDDKEDEKKAEEAMVAGDDQVQERQAKIYKIDMDHASKVLSMHEDEPKVQEVVDVVTTAKLITEVVTAASESVTATSITITTVEPQVPAATITAALVRVVVASTRRRKRVVIKDPEEESTTIIPSETKSKDKGKGIVVEEPKPMKKKQQVEMDEEYARKLHEELNKDIDWDVAIDHVKQKAKEDPFVQRYQVMKKRPQTEAQARRNMIMYLKNVAGFRLDYFKGMSYDDIRLIFEAKFNLNITFLLKSKEQLEEEENRAIQSINETSAQKAKATPLARKVPVVDYEIIHIDNKPHYKIIRVDGTHQLPDRQTQVWKSQRTVHGQAKVKSWKLLESCGVHIITFTTTQLILLVERRYPLLRFTLDQMLNVVRLRLEEQSEMSLELLRFTRQQYQEGQLE